MNKKKLKNKLAKMIRKTYELEFIMSLKIAKAVIRDRMEELELDSYFDGYEIVYTVPNSRGVGISFNLFELNNMKNTMEKVHGKIYQCFVCRKCYQSEKKATTCCSQPVVDEDGDWGMSRKNTSRKPLATTHTCPNVRHGGKNWSVWLHDGETCPMCHYTYLPR